MTMTMRANIVMQYWHLRQRPTTDTTDGGGDFCCRIIDLEAVVEVIGPVAVMVVVVPASSGGGLGQQMVVEILAMEILIWKQWWRFLAQRR